MSLFAKKTVDSVVASFSKMIRDLEEVRAEASDEADRQDNVRIAAIIARDAAIDEAERALAIREKIEALVD